MQCNVDGTADVSISLELTNTTPNLVFAQFRGGADATVISAPFTGFTPGSSDIMTGVFRYPTPITPQPVMLVHVDVDNNPTGCPPFIVEIGPIEDCRRECPLASRIDVEIGGCERDPNDNLEKRRVTFTPTVVGPVPTAYYWDFGDGETIGGTNAPTAISHLYSGIPTFPPSLCLIGPDNCGQSCIDVPLSDFSGFEPCACPTLNGVTVSIGDCVPDPNGNGQKREVTFTPIVSGPPPSSHFWDFGDGQTDGSAGPATTKPHLYDNAPTTPPRLCISGPEPCPDQCLEVPLSQFDNFEPCGGGEGGGGGNESTGCGFMRIAVAVLIALAILAALLAICVPAAATVLAWIAAGSAFLGVILGLIYSFLCPNKPCKVGLLISGQATLAAGVVAIVLSACCTWLLWTGLALVGSGLGLLYLWKTLCKRSLCAMAKEIVKVLGGIILPVLGILVGIPVIGATCFSGVALAVVSGVFGPVSVYAATC